MANCAISDLHGQYDAYRKMLDKIQFSKEDVLYVLGDVLDRGPHPVKKNHVAIDCGVSFEGGRLGCLCLDAGEEFYVEKEGEEE